MKIAFNTANLVGRVTGYRFHLSNWMDQHNGTIAATDEAEWGRICAEIAAAGYKAVEVWQAHADPSVMTEARAAAWGKIMADNGLEGIAYAGGVSEETLRVCQWLGIPRIAGGGMLGDAAAVSAACEKAGIAFCYENHPEKSTAEIQARIAGGDPKWVGVAVDLGWLGTQGVDAPACLRELGSAVHHVHVKDVHAVGGHETVPLGQGCVRVDECLKVLHEIGYTGWYSWEDEPEDRNPFDVAVSCREWIEARIG
jgi:sugar phosphate isomerase/epimerase